jgi:predicted O-methyltransferase YrrM
LVALGIWQNAKFYLGYSAVHLSGQMPHEAQIIGAGAIELSDEEYRDIVRAAIAEFGAIDHSDT